MLESNKMEEEVNKMEEEANKMEEEANKMDEEANKMDEEANKMDETTIKMDTNANEIDQNTNKMVKEANKMDKAKNHNRQAGLSSKPGGTLNIPQTTQCCKTSDCSDYQGTEARTRNGNACRPWPEDDKIKLTRMNQHKNDVTSNKNEENLSGISKHARQCNTVRESLEIRHLKTSSNDGLNDPQLCVRSNAWDPILQKI